MNRLARPLLATAWLSLALVSSGNSAAAEESPVTFEKIQLTDQFYCEGAHYGDFNRDGHTDVVAGPFWYAGPDFTTKHEIYKPKAYKPKGYSQNFLTFTHDFNDDGWTDVLVFGWPGKETSWHENPQNKPGHWKRHVIFDVTDNESPVLGDLTGDGRPEVIFHTGGRYGYATADAKDPTAKWTFHPVSEKIAGGRYQHGLGYGDIDGDGRADLMFKDGWLQQPASLDGDPLWTLHRFDFAPGKGGAQMYAYDFDGDGDNDVLTSLNAHGYGLVWYEHVKKDGRITFLRHLIMSEKPEPGPFGVSFSQLHGIDLVDMNGDGLKDIITGKRWWAHGGRDPGGNQPAVLYWFQTVRGADGVRFVPHKIDNNSGVGTQVVAADVTGDKRPDIISANKKGTFLFLQRK